MHISYVSDYNPHDIHKWSGTPHYIARILDVPENQIDYINKFRINKGWNNIYRSVRCSLKGKKFDLKRTDYVLRQYARQIKNQLTSNTDLIFAPSSLFFPYLDTPIPKVFYTDACYAAMVGFYPDFSNYCAESIEAGNRLEKMALDNCSLIIYSSDWAAQTAIDHYNIAPEKISVVPFGANVESVGNYIEIKSLVDSRKTNECHLLFCGVDWERKRGKFAVKVAEILNENGLKTILHIAGIKKLPERDLPDFIVNHGFISKSTKEGKETFDQLFCNSHFLLVPTMAEAYGLVFAEANAYGLPAIATDVGGVSTIIKNQINGMAFPLTATEQEYAAYIEATFRDTAKYRQLAYSSFAEYEKRLNWKVAGKELLRLFREII